MGPFRAKRGNLRARRHVRLHLEALEDRWLPSQIFTVNSAADDPLGEPAGSSVVTLRDAINALNLDTSTTFSNPDVISFAIASGTQTINLAANLPAINEHVVIDGSTQLGYAGAPLISVNGGGSFALFDNNFASVTIIGLAITNGHSAGDGGGILNYGTMTLQDCTITNNSAAGNGGGVCNNGTITLSNCTITNNVAGGNGGGLANIGSETANGLTVSGNSAGTDGGGIYNTGTMGPDDNWTVQNNNAGDNGGGIYSAGSLTVSDALITCNSALGTSANFATDSGDAGNGGGIYNGFSLSLSNATIAGNHASGTGVAGMDGGSNPFFNVGGNGGNGGCGGGIFSTGGSVFLSTSTVSGNTASGTGGAGGNGGAEGKFDNIGGNGGDGGCGGGIDSINSTLLLTNVTVAGNQTNGQGGNGGAGGITTAGNSTKTGGTGGSGGSGAGIHAVFGPVQLTDVTVAANQVLGGSAGAGGAAGAGGSNSTNTAGDPGNGATGGGLNTTAANSSYFALFDTIVANNAAPNGTDIYAPTVQADYSIIGDGSGISGGVTGANGSAVADQIGTTANPINPLLGPLQDNGGPTQTMGLFANSPALDAGIAATDPITFLAVTTDQRGSPRPSDVGAVTDIGAFQGVLSEGQAPTITSANVTTFTVGAAGSFTVTTSGAVPAPAKLSEQGALPNNVTFVDQGNGSAILSGMPATGTGGVYAFTITAANQDGSLSSTQTFTLTVEEAPSITSSNAATFRVGAAGSFTVTTRGGFPVPVSLSESRTLPNNVTFVDQGNGSAILSGTPATGTGGTYTFTITAANQDGTLGSTQTFTLTVLPLPTKFTSFVSSANPVVSHQPVTFTVTVATTFSGGLTPTGSVDFFDQTTGVDLGKSGLVGGVASMTTSALVAPKNHTIIATYSNTDGNFAPPSAPAVLTEQVVKPTWHKHGPKHHGHHGLVEHLILDGWNSACVWRSAALAAYLDTTVFHNAVSDHGPDGVQDWLFAIIDELKRSLRPQFRR